MDIAVLVSDKVMRRNPLDYRLDLMTKLSSALNRNDIDLILLNQASPLLAHRVLRDGKLILERSPSARIKFHVQTLNRYLDMEPLRDIFLSYLKKQVKEGKVLG